MSDNITNNFYLFLINYFKVDTKTTWGKRELVDKLKDLYIEFITKKY